MHSFKANFEQECDSIRTSSLIWLNQVYCQNKGSGVSILTPTPSNNYVTVMVKCANTCNGLRCRKILGRKFYGSPRKSTTIFERKKKSVRGKLYQQSNKKKITFCLVPNKCHSRNRTGDKLLRFVPTYKQYILIMFTK